MSNTQTVEYKPWGDMGGAWESTPLAMVSIMVVISSSLGSLRWCAHFPQPGQISQDIERSFAAYLFTWLHTTPILFLTI